MRTDYITETSQFWEDYLMQGGGLNAFAGVPFQRGAGLGGLFKGLFRLVSPLLKKALPLAKTVGLDIGKRVVEGGADIIGDISEGQRFGDAVKKSIKRKSAQAFGDVRKRIADELQSGQGIGNRIGLKSIGRRKLDIYDGKASG